MLSAFFFITIFFCWQCHSKLANGSSSGSSYWVIPSPRPSSPAFPVSANGHSGSSQHWRASTLIPQTHIATVSKSSGPYMQDNVKPDPLPPLILEGLRSHLTRVPVSPSVPSARQPKGLCESIIYNMSLIRICIWQMFTHAGPTSTVLALSKTC